MGRRTIVIETRGDICMSDRDNPRSLVEIMNDVLSTVREHYDSFALAGLLNVATKRQEVEI